MGQWIPPRTWVSGEQVTSDALNEFVRDMRVLVCDATVNLTPLSGWTVSTQPRAYRKAGITHVHGSCSNGPTAVFTPLFVLPTGWGPGPFSYMHTVGAGALGYVMVRGDTVEVGENLAGATTLYFNMCWPSSNE